MKVFRYSLDEEYANGVMLIAAINREDADKLAEEISERFNRWDYDFEMYSLTANNVTNNRPYIILKESHKEW